MLTRDFERLLPLAILLVVFTITVVVLRFNDYQLTVLSPFIRHSKNKDTDVGNSTFTDQHHEVFSVSTRDHKYFRIEFGSSQSAANPSIIPHPSLENTWYIIGQLHRKQSIKEGDIPHPILFDEIVCSATFNEDRSVLSCTTPPTVLPIEATGGNPEKCTGDTAYFPLSVGPHDARVFFGPDSAYVLYGSNSFFTCFGQWMADFRPLVNWESEMPSPDNFRNATEIQRPSTYAPVEKNFFIFWDAQGLMYAHYDIFPRRAFSMLSDEGSATPDLAPAAAQNDEPCMARFMPPVAIQYESIHQATNSLSVTMCERNDPNCQPSESNTFIMTIFHHKSFYDFHGVYEPYVMLFRQSSPFEIHALSTKPIWIHGRGRPGQWERIDPEDGSRQWWNQTQMLYVTSISWKTHGQKYHGYRDDVMFLGFGIEDVASAGVDVVAGDLLTHMGICDGL